ncbi:MAG: thioredoxin family protein [Methanosarcinales archaeon]
MDKEDMELAKIRQKKLEQLMKRQQELQSGAVSTSKKPKILIEVFTSPTCPYCPRAVQMAKYVESQMPNVIVREISTATQEGWMKAVQYGIQAVPMIFINGKQAFVGAPPSVDALKRVISAYV